MSELRDRLAHARLMLVFCPELVETGRGPTRDPQAVLEACLPEVDAVQVRVKAPGRRSGPSPARAVHDWTLRVLGLCHAIGDDAPLVLVNDRVDVALALARAGCAGCHVGQDDLTPRDARDLLGPDALLGLSTHGARQVADAATQPVDYLGFGPVFPTSTKGYSRGLGPEVAWVAANAAGVPVFPIGGIDETNADELAIVGRAAVGAAVLLAEAPDAAARALRESLLAR